MATAAEIRAMTRAAIMLTGCAATLAVVLPAFLHPVPRLIWNASASVPIGLYAVQPAGTLRVGELLVVTPPAPLAAFLADRLYLPEGVPLLKHSAAVPGQIVCRIGRVIIVDGIALGDALARDRRGRALPVWQGCRTVRSGEFFPMNPQSEDSLDGRYFGPLPATAIIGRAKPLWTEKGP
jgi:conjugative transfer signal peptidase TraF